MIKEYFPAPAVGDPLRLICEFIAACLRATGEKPTGVTFNGRLFERAYDAALAAGLYADDRPRAGIENFYFNTNMGTVLVSRGTADD